jgi:hypothetical protein
MSFKLQGLATGQYVAGAKDSHLENHGKVGKK